MQAAEAAASLMSQGVSPALAIYRASKEYGTTTGNIQRKLALRRQRKNQEARQRVAICADCGVLPAEYNGLCTRCAMATASTEG
jgi:uncharacterized paraquat-inducible protein A